MFSPSTVWVMYRKDLTVTILYKSSKILLIINRQYSQEILRSLKMVIYSSARTTEPPASSIIQVKSCWKSYWACHQWGCLQKDPSSRWKIWRTSDLGRETKAEEVWPHLKVFWFSKDDSTGHSEREKWRGRQKKKWEDNIKEWQE